MDQAKEVLADLHDSLSIARQSIKEDTETDSGNKGKRVLFLLSFLLDHIMNRNRLEPRIYLINSIHYFRLAKIHNNFRHEKKMKQYIQRKAIPCFYDQ